MATDDIKNQEKHEDFINWDKLIQHCQKLEDLTDYEKERAKRAFQKLREELGEQFLADAFESRHPICEYIVNLAPWTRKWIIWFAEAISEAKNQKNYQSLLNRIKDKDKFSEALSILEIAYKFSKAGFNLSIDPSIKVSDREKVPDLKLIDNDTKEELYAEVSISYKSRTAEDADKTMKKIIEPLFEPLWWSVPFLQYCGRIHKTLSEKHLEAIVKKIEETVDKVKRESKFQELAIEDVIEMGIAPENDKQLLELWAKDRGLKVGEVHGPPYNVDEIYRAKIKIEKEQKQLPRDCPNILIIKSNNIFFNIHDIRKVISELEEAVYDYPHLLAVVVAGGHMGFAENEITMKDQHVFIKKTNNDLLVEQYIILFNKFCELRISPSTITKIYNSFRSY